MSQGLSFNPHSCTVSSDSFQVPLGKLWLQHILGHEDSFRLRMQCRRRHNSAEERSYQLLCRCVEECDNQPIKAKVVQPIFMENPPFPMQISRMPSMLQDSPATRETGSEWTQPQIDVVLWPGVGKMYVRNKHRQISNSLFVVRMACEV